LIAVNWEQISVQQAVMSPQPLPLDCRDLPAYSAADAARYLGIPIGTLQSWLRGRSYPTSLGPKRFEPLIERPNPAFSQMSFTNLVEAHMLRVIRQVHTVRLDKVRTALDYFEQQFQVRHPLANIQFQTDGVDLFVESIGRLINASRSGQLAMREMLQHLLKQVEYEQGMATKLYLLSSGRTDQSQANVEKTLVIDPRISYGRPLLVGTGIPADVLVSRYKAGESIDDIAEDYSCDRLQVEDAIRCELLLQVAA
jgi:uncharacterized protein (DUF433 family)